MLEVILLLVQVDLLVSADRKPCSTCRSYGIQHTPGNMTLENKYLKGYNNSPRYVPDIEACFLSCIFEDCKCASMNFKVTPEANGTHLCESNYETKSSVNATQLISKDGYYYIDIMSSNTKKDGNCSCKTSCCDPNPCLNGGTCVERCTDARRFQCTCTMCFTGRFCQDKKGIDMTTTSGESSDYVLVHNLTLDLSQFTLSLWMKSSDTSHPGACIFSYASFIGGDNTIGLMSIGSGLYFYVQGIGDESAITLNDGLWHHLVVMWENKDGNFSIYKDGILTVSGSGRAIGSVISKHGVLILGQEQDSIGGGFDGSQAYIGTLSDIQLWDQVLFPREAGHSCYSGNHGNAFSWCEVFEKAEIRGTVDLSSPSSCW